MLELKDVDVMSGSKKLISGVNLSVNPGEIVAMMGPNGSGKSTLARAIMGDPRLEVKGSIKYNGEELTGLPANERADRGLFMSFQNPPEIGGVKTAYFLRASADFSERALAENIESLNIKGELLTKDIHSRFSGGERKKIEVLQAMLMDPQLIILDEIDSGLDIDSLKFLGKFIRGLKSRGKGVLIITHYARVFANLHPDRVYVMKNGAVSHGGGPEVVHELDENGFGGWKE